MNDYRKYALLRHLARSGARIGICWMLTPPDAGNLRAYLNQPAEWRDFDPELFDQLEAIIRREEVSRLAAIETLGVIPGASFYNAVLRDRAERTTYFNSALDRLAAADLIFFDPDNGVAPHFAIPQPRRSSKFVYPEEIAATYRRGHSVLLYQHFPRKPRDQFITGIGAQLTQLAPSAELWYFRTPFAVFLLLIQPRHGPTLAAAAETTPPHWRPRFIIGARLQDR